VIRLSMEVTRIKTVLSQVQEASMQIEGLYEGVDLNSSVTRARFEGMNGSLFSTMTSKIKETIESFGCNATHVILTGGNCKVPRVQQLLQQCFQGIKILSSINPTDVNAIGAAIQANILEARGTQNMKDLSTVSSLPLSIGIGGHDGTFVPVLLKGSLTPIKVVKRFGNSSDTQTDFFLSIYEGEDVLVENNRLLGHFVLGGLAPAPVGETIINVEFLVDSSGVLSVQASHGSALSLLKFDSTKERQTIPEGEVVG